MWKVVLSDDEPIILEGIKQFIPWSKYGCMVPRTFPDGINALEGLRESPADILITDIRMPGLDGLDLIRKASEEKLCRFFILLTGYSDIEYAQKAIRFGAIDFILKNNPLPKLEKALSKTAQLLKDEERRKENASHLAAQLAMYQSGYRSELLLGLIYGTQPAALIRDKLSSAGLELSRYYMIDCRLENQKGLRESNKALLATAHFLEMSFHDYEKYVLIAGEAQVCLILYSKSSSLPGYSETEQHMVSVRESAKQLLGITLYMHLGQLQTNLMDLYGVFADEGEAVMADPEETGEDSSLLSKGTGSSDLVMMAARYIEDNFRYDITLADIADHVHMNPSYVSSAFKRKAGKSVIEYLTERRIANAKKMLLEPGTKISDIAKESGFKEVSYFSTIFKKMTGYTPGEYQNTFASER